MSKIKIAAVQMPTVSNKMENVRKVREYLEKLKDQNLVLWFFQKCSAALIRQKIFRPMRKKKAEKYGSSFRNMQSTMVFIS